MTDRLPDFLVVGAMKCATTTLHEQLARQPGLFLSRPKEPNFFSDDAVYARGLAWYAGLFRDAPAGSLCGESSTHYTKRPTYPDAADRIARHVPGVKIIYVMRHPVDRLVSHYVHERTTGRVTCGIREAVEAHPELIAYGQYARQIEPYLERFGPDRVLPVFFRRLSQHPQAELDRIGRFLGHPGGLVWDASLKAQNVGSERLRRSALREALVRAPILTPLRRRLIPRSWAESVKSLWRARVEPPPLPPDVSQSLRDAFDPDLARLGGWLGVRLDCDNFREVTRSQTLDWSRDRIS